jgi:hypothetical protein
VAGERVGRPKGRISPGLGLGRASLVAEYWPVTPDDPEPPIIRLLSRRMEKLVIGACFTFITKLFIY